jgi:hypothetical protein
VTGCSDLASRRNDSTVLVVQKEISVSSVSGRITGFRRSGSRNYGSRCKCPIWRPCRQVGSSYLSESASAELMRSFKTRLIRTIEGRADLDSVRNARFAVLGREPTKAQTDDLRPHRVLRPGHVGGMVAACSRCIIWATAIRLTFARNRESAAGVFRWSTCVRTKEIVEGLRNSLCLL